LACLNSKNFASSNVRAYLPDIELPMPMPGSVSLCVFHPGNDNRELLSWISELSLRDNEVKGILFYSIVWPGNRINLLPPSQRLETLRRETQSALREYERDEEEDKLLQAMRIIYVGDWEKKLYRRYSLDTQTTALLLFDSEGHEAGRWERFSKISALSLRTALFKLRQTTASEINPMEFSGFSSP